MDRPTTQMYMFLMNRVGLQDQQAIRMAKQFKSVGFDIDNFGQENAISLICKMAPLIEAHTIEHKDIMQLLNYMKGMYSWPDFYSNAEHLRPIKIRLIANGNEYLV